MTEAATTPAAPTAPQPAGTTTVVHLAGRIDVLTVSDIRERLHAAVDAGTGTLVVDLSDVEGIDAIGLGMLVGTQRRAQRAGRQLVLRGTPPRFARLLRATRLQRVLPTEPVTVTAA